MASLKYTGGQSTLSAGYTAGDSSITVASGSSFPSSGDFWVRIGGSTAGCRKCTSRSGNTLTLSGSASTGTTDANQLSGAPVYEVLTPESIDQLKTDLAGGAHGFGVSFGEIGGSDDLVAGLTVPIDDLPYGGTIAEFTLGISPSGASATVEIWMITSPTTARPTVADTINTSGVSISSNTRLHSTTLTDFTTLVVPAGASIVAHLKAATGAKQVSFSVEMT